jgi:hypothetical protein
MPSLGETYERRAGAASRRQVVLGTGLFATGAVLVVGAILTGATGLLIGHGFTVYQGREIAGVLAGLGLPAVFVGITIVLPATNLHRAASVVGSGLAVLGVMLFRYAYPGQWYAAPGVPSDLVLGLILVYFAGVITTFWALFTAVATFKTRNDPGGTVSLTVSKGSAAAKAVEAVQTEFQNASKAIGGLGSIGTFGGVETGTQDFGPTPHTTASRSDGGTATDAEIVEPEPSGPQTPPGPGPDEDTEVVRESDDVEPDRYCGNCTHFDYEQDGTGMHPYCGLYDQRMEDMEACQWWERNN